MLETESKRPLEQYLSHIKDDLLNTIYDVKKYGVRKIWTPHYLHSKSALTKLSMARCRDWMTAAWTHEQQMVKQKSPTSGETSEG